MTASNQQRCAEPDSFIRPTLSVACNNIKYANPSRLCIFASVTSGNNTWCVLQIKCTSAEQLVHQCICSDNVQPFSSEEHSEWALAATKYAAIPGPEDEDATAIHDGI